MLGTSDLVLLEPSQLDLDDQDDAHFEGGLTYGAEVAVFHDYHEPTDGELGFRTRSTLHCLPCTQLQLLACYTRQNVQHDTQTQTHTDRGRVT